MRQGTYRTAYDEANAELQDILTQFEQLRLRKEQVETVVEALKPFLGLQSESTSDLVSQLAAAPVEPAAEPVEFTYMQLAASQPETISLSISQPDPEAAKTEEEATPEQVAYFRQPSSDPFQRRIDDALWGWQQRPEGLLSPI